MFREEIRNLATFRNVRVKGNMGFQYEAIEFIESCYSGEIESDNNVIHLTNNNLRFKFIPIPKSVEEEALQSDRYTGIPIWEDQWLTKNAIIKSRLLSLLGKTERIYGRETKVIKLDQPQADTFLNKNHLIGSTKAKSKFGLEYQNEIVAMATFSKPTPMTRDGAIYQSYEMIRYCTKNGFTVVGGLSKLINHFITAFSPDDIMTYIDLEWSQGRSFEQMGFKNTERTPSQNFWINPDEMVRYYPHRLPVGLSDNADELHRNNYFRIHNSGNLKFIKLLK